MKLQVAIDLGDTQEMLKLVEQISAIADIVEVGTPLIIREGQKPVRTLRDKYPELCILADTKIMDGGALEANYALEAGADIVTVLAVAADETIKAVIATTRECGKETLVDMINCQNFVTRVKEVEEMGADYIGVHTASDIQSSGKTPIDELRLAVETVRKAKVAVAGGIGLHILADIAAREPDVIIAGSKISTSSDPYETVLAFKKIMNKEN